MGLGGGDYNPFHNLMMINYKKNIGIQWVLMLAMIYWAGSFSIAHNIISNKIFAVFLAALVLLAMFLLREKIIIKYDYIIFYICIGVIFLINVAINKQNLLNELSLMFMLILFVLAISTMDFDTFRFVYCDVMTKICVVSLVFFLLYIIFPRLNSLMVVTDSDGALVSNLYVFNKFTNLNRNCGFFWEPGTFQTFIVISAIFDFSLKRIKIHRMIIYFLTIISTFSTTGYIALFFLLILLFSNKYSNSKSVKRVLFLLFLFSLLFLLFNQNLFFSYKETSTTFGKLINFFENKNNANLTSASVRINAITKPFLVFIENPLFGVGFDNLKIATWDYTHGMNTCTFINYFAVYGMFYGVFAIRGYLGLAKKTASHLFSRIVIMLLFFITTISENYVRNTFFTALIILGNSIYPTKKTYAHESKTRFNCLRMEQSPHENIVF